MIARYQWFLSGSKRDAALGVLKTFCGDDEDRFEKWREYLLESMQENLIGHGVGDEEVFLGVLPKKPQLGGPR